VSERVAGERVPPARRPRRLDVPALRTAWFVGLIAAGCAAPASGTFSRVEWCPACLSTQATAGTARLEFGEDGRWVRLVESERSWLSPVADWEGVRALHAHDWRTFTETVGCGDESERRCARPYANELVERLVRSQELRDAVRAHVASGVLTAEGVERALHHRETSGPPSADYDRVLAVARGCPGWTEPSIRPVETK
jgi:hypothetical protein